jgi:hypothetical protein
VRKDFYVVSYDSGVNFGVKSKEFKQLKCVLACNIYSEVLRMY